MGQQGFIASLAKDSRSLTDAQVIALRRCCNSMVRSINRFAEMPVIEDLRHPQMELLARATEVEFILEAVLGDDIRRELVQHAITMANMFDDIETTSYSAKDLRLPGGGNVVD